MKIVCISDTHNRHRELEVPECDLLIHAGDFTNKGTETEISQFANWLKTLYQAKHKIVIPGNHDILCQKNSPLVSNLFHTPDKSISYLNNSWITYNKLTIYGTPWTPYFYDWAFNGIPTEHLSIMIPDRDHPSLCSIYDRISRDIDILICHGPPLGILDKVQDTLGNKHKVGSSDMKHTISTMNKLKLYVCGHIHDSYGIYSELNTLGNTITYVNASICQSNSIELNKPILIEL